MKKPTLPVNVPANQRITSSVRLDTGEPVYLTASGQWNIYGDPARACGPGGSGVQANNGGPNGNWPQAGISEGCLLVYVGNKIFTHFTDGDPVMAVGPGVLGFGPNDNRLDDNSGTIQVQVAFGDDSAKS